MMADKKTTRAGQGTFAKLYDAHEEQLNRRSTKPLGRPPKKVQRKPTTVHLTQSENRNLSQLHLTINEHFSINRSELVGVAVDALKTLLEENGGLGFPETEIHSIEAFRQFVFDFIKSKNQKIKKSKNEQ